MRFLSMWMSTTSHGEVVGTPSIMMDGSEFLLRVIRALFGVACIYAQVVKTWRKDGVIQVERRTPAMVAGLRDRVCSFREVFAFA